MRSIRLYESWGKPDKAAACKVKLGLADLPADVLARPERPAARATRLTIQASDEPSSDVGAGGSRLFRPTGFGRQPISFPDNPVQP